MSFKVNPIGFRIEFTKELSELKNTLVLLYESHRTSVFLSAPKMSN